MALWENQEQRAESGERDKQGCAARVVRSFRRACSWQSGGSTASTGSNSKRDKHQVGKVTSADLGSKCQPTLLEGTAPLDEGGSLTPRRGAHPTAGVLQNTPLLTAATGPVTRRGPSLTDYFPGPVATAAPDDRSHHDFHFHYSVRRSTFCPTQIWSTSILIKNCLA